MIDNRLCSYVLTIAECRSFSRAAEQLYIAQPSLSRYIKNLEESLGICLFDRTRIPLVLTPAGKCYVEYIRKFQKLQNAMNKKLAAFGQDSSHKLEIGSLTFLASYILPRVIPVFVEAYSNADVGIHELRSNQMRNSLLSGDVDVFITNLPPNYPDLDFCSIAEDRVLLVTKRTKSLELEYDLSENSMEHPLSICISTLQNATFVMLKPWQNMHIIAENIFRTRHFVPDKIIEAPSITSAISLTSQKHHFTFVCESALRYAKPDMPLAYFLTGDNDSPASIIVTYRKNNANPLIGEFCRCAKSVFEGSENL